MQIFEALKSYEGLEVSHFEMLVTSQLKTLDLNWLTLIIRNSKDVKKIFKLVAARCPVRKKLCELIYY